MVQRRAHFHDSSVLSVDTQFASHSAIRANRFRACLSRSVPRSRGAHVVFRLRHQRARGAHTDAVPAIDARRFRQRNLKFRGNMRVKSASRHADRKGILCIDAARLHALVAEDAFRVVPYIQRVIDFRRLRDLRGPRAEPLKKCAVFLHVGAQLWRRRNVHRRRQKFQHHAPAQPHALGIRSHHHSCFHFARARRHQRSRAFQFHHTHAAYVDRRQRLEEAKRRRIDSNIPRRIKNRRAFRHRHAFSIDRDSDFTSRLGHRNFRRRRARHRNQRRRSMRLFAHEKRPHRSIAERIAPEAVCPSPQIEASRIACAISLSNALSCSLEPSGLRPTNRCSASSCRIVPTRHGTHCPHVSLRKKAAMRRRICFKSTESSNSITTPEPSVAPMDRVPSNVSGVSSSFGETKLPAAPPSRTACKRPVPPTPPAISMMSRIVGPNGVSYTPGRTTWPETQNSRYPEEIDVPIRAYAAPPVRIISGTLMSVSTLLTTVGCRNNPLCVGNGGLLRGSPR